MLKPDRVLGPVLRVTVEVLGPKGEPARTILYRRQNYAEAWQQHDLLTRWMYELLSVSADREERRRQRLLELNSYVCVELPELDAADAG